MRSFLTVALVLVLVPTLALAKDKTKKPIVSAAFRNATYVYVESVDGGQYDPNLYPEDRQAIGDVQDALQEWKRYTLTVRRDEAELIIVVRKGRLAEANVGGSVGTGSGPQGVSFPGRTGQSGSGNGPGTGPNPGPSAGPSRGLGVGGEAGTSDDLFEVCQGDGNGKVSAPIWMHTRRDGLDTPDLTLFKQFKDAVDKAYPMQTASQPPKP